MKLKCPNAPRTDSQGNLISVWFFIKYFPESAGIKMRLNVGSFHHYMSTQANSTGHELLSLVTHISEPLPNECLLSVGKRKNKSIEQGSCYFVIDIYQNLSKVFICFLKLDHTNNSQECWLCVKKTQQLLFTFYEHFMTNVITEMFKMYLESKLFYYIL